MASPSSGGFGELAHRLEVLEARVRLLEERSSGSLSFFSPTGIQPVVSSDLGLQDAERMVPLLGKGLLGLAGAYLLRALATSSLAPSWVGIALALAYGLGWMFLATRAESTSLVVGAVYMATAVLAVTPMLWETTVRLHLMAPAVAALSLAGFVVLTLVLCWKREPSPIAWLAASAGAITALALALATGDLLPFCAALITMAAAFEIAFAYDLWSGPRKVIGAAVGLAVLLLFYIHSSGPRAPESYRPVPEILQWATPSLLLLVYAAGVGVRTLGRKLDAGVFDIFQLALTFTLCVLAVIREPGNYVYLGSALLFSAAICDWLCFVRLKASPQIRSIYMYGVFGLGLTLLGTFLCLPRDGASIVYAFAAILFAIFGSRAGELPAVMQALCFVGAAGIGSGLAWQTFSLLLRDGTQLALTTAVLFAFVAMIAVYLLLRDVVPKAIAATMLAWVLTAGAAALLLALFGRSADSAWRAEIRTTLIIATAVMVAAIGSRWQRPELYWLVPGGLAIALYRLIAEDFPQGRPETLFLSLLFYGGAMVLLSKFIRERRHG